MRPLKNKTKVRNEQNKQRLDAVSALQKGLATQTYDMTKLKVFSPKRHMQEGETLTGELTMVKAYEEFEFRAHEPERWTRNPKVFQGKYINVHRDKNGHYQVHLKKLELRKRLNVIRVAKAIETELLTAKKVLGL